MCVGVQRIGWVKRFLVSPLALADMALVLLVMHGGYRHVAPSACCLD